MTLEKNTKGLIVEDDPFSVELLKLYLEDLNYTMLTAGSYEEALSIARSAKPDFIVSDFSLPDGCGVDLIKQLKGEYAFIAIAVTGNSAVKDGSNPEFDLLLQKPIDLESIGQFLKRSFL